MNAWEYIFGDNAGDMVILTGAEVVPCDPHACGAAHFHVVFITDGWTHPEGDPIRVPIQQVRVS